MIRRAAGATLSITLIGIAALTLWALAAHSDGLALRHVSAVTVGLTLVLIAFATVVEMPLEGDALSLGYDAGLLAILALGQSSDLFSAVAVIGAGGLLGGAIRAVWRDWQGGRALGPHTIEEALYAAVQLILALAVGEVIYIVFGGELPLTGLHMRAVPPLIGLIGSSLVVYGAIYALRLTRLRIDPRRVFAANRYAIGVALVLPISFALAGTLVIPVSLVGFAILATGVLLLAVLSSELGRQRLRYRQQVRELSSLSALNQAMRANLDLSALLETIRLQIASRLEVETIVIALYEPVQEVVQFPVVYRSGRIDRRRARPLDPTRPLDYVIQRQAALRLAPDAAANARARGLQPPEISAPAPAAWMGVPLLASDRTIGALAIATSPDRAFTADDQRLLTTIAAQSAISIDNAQLYEQSQTHARQLSQLNEWAARLGATLDPLHVFDLVIEAATEITGADGTALFVCLDDPARTLALTRSKGLSATLRNDPPVPVVLTDNAHSTQALAIGRAATDPRAAPIRERLIAEGFAAWIELTIRDSRPEAPASGALVAYYRQPHRFVPEEIELLRAFANQAAAAIHNAQTYRSTNEALELRIAQLSALASINQELASTLDPQHLFARVLDYAVEGTNSINGALLLRPNTDLSPLSASVPRIVAQRGRDIRKTTEFMTNATIIRALETNQPVIERTALPELSVPIAHDGEVMGVLIMQSMDKDAYPPDDVLFVRHLATQAVIAVDNARLFSRVEESRDRLQAILDSMHEAVLLIDAGGHVLLANPQVEFMFNLPQTRISGQAVAALVADPSLNFAAALGFESEVLLDLIRQMQAGRWLGDSNRQSYRIETPAVRFLDRTIVATHARNGTVNGLLMVFADATEERELAQAREDLTRMIVHDLRAPLTAISTSMRLLTEIGSDDPKVARALSRTVDASQRALRKLLHLVDSLLDIAKIESGTITLDRSGYLLGPIVQGVQLELSPLAEDLDVKFDIRIPDALPPVWIDAPKIERVLLNLVDNALKFTPVNRTVTVKAYPSPEHIGFARIEVVDTGPGIPDAYKARIFDRFEQINGTQGRRRGTGLGLTFCKLAVEAHGGQIWIEDNPGGGSIFAFALPFATALPAALADSSGSAPAHRLGQRHAE